jgi:drug/metabolite transporter (DMT)-like permease
MRTWVALATVYVAWGATYPAIKVLGETVPPLVGMGARFLLAGLLLMAVRPRPGTWRQRAAAAGVGVWILGDIGLIAWAEQHVDAGLASLLIASVPLWVIGVRAVLRQRPARAELVAVAVGFAGLVVLLRPGSVALAWGALLLVAAVLEASGEVGSQRLTQPPDALTATAWQLCGAGVVLLVAGAAIGEPRRVDWAGMTAATGWAFAFLVLPGSVLAYAAFVWLLAHRPVQLVATYAYVNPVIAVGLGAVLLGERIDALTVVGAVLVLLAVAAAVRSTAFHREPADAR